jgi:DNA-binding SARP family transcriptional activator
MQAGSRPRGVRARTENGGPIELHLLRAFELTLDGDPVLLPMSGQRLLAFLALHDRPLHRPFVAGALWLDTTEERASACLRSLLWRLRGPGYPVVEASGGHLALGSGVVVDLRETRTLAQRVLDDCIDWNDLGRLEDSLSSDLLPQWYEDWVLIERERFRQLRLRALESLCEQLLSAHRFEDALEAGLAAVAGEPLRESAHRALIRVHLAEGNRAEAVRQYQLYRQLLLDELGVDPSPLMEDLMGGLRQRAS